MSSGYDARCATLKASAQARHNAIRRLIAAHGDEFDRIYAEERCAKGLPPRGVSDEMQWLRNRVAELEMAHA